MTEEETKNELVEIDSKLDIVPVNEEQKKIIKEIIKADNYDELQKQFDCFNIAQSKKNAIRIMKLEALLGRVEDQAIERIEKNPNQISNKELFEMMNIISNQMERANKAVESTLIKPTTVQAIQKNDITVNVNAGELNRDSKEKVIDAISGLLKQLNQNVSAPSQPIEIVPVDNNVIIEDAETVEEVEEKPITLPLLDIDDED